jgi:hypothetical protein
MYHCHLMWHEDMGRIAQFTVVDPDQVDSAHRTLEVDHGQMAANDDHGFAGLPAIRNQGHQPLARAHPA